MAYECSNDTINNPFQREHPNNFRFELKPTDLPIKNDLHYYQKTLNLLAAPSGQEIRDPIKLPRSPE